MPDPIRRLRDKNLPDAGVEIPGFVEVIYEVSDYIPADEHRERKAQAIKELERQGGFRSAQERLRQRYDVAREALERIESSLAHEQSELDDLDINGVREKRTGLFHSKWVFRGVEYDLLDEANERRRTRKVRDRQ